jgi:hypothetical protein
VADYFFDEGALDLPEVDGPWADRTVHVLEAPAPGGGRYSFLISRETLPDGAELGAVVEARIAEMPRALRGHRLLGRREAVIGGLPAVELKFTWKHPDGMMFHHMAYVAVYRTLLTFTASCQASLADPCSAWMAQALAGVRLRER